MRTSLLLALTSVAGLGRAQETTSAPAVPTPPVVVTAPVTPSAPPVVQAPGPAPSGSTPASVTQIVYTPQLPAVSDLTGAAAAQGLTVERVVQTAGQVIVFYRNASGQPLTVAYQSLPPSGAVPAAAPVVTNPAPVVVTAPPTVVYETAPRVIYYDYPRYYYARPWYPPVSFSFGVGYRSHHGGGFRHHHR